MVSLKNLFFLLLLLTPFTSFFRMLGFNYLDHFITFSLYVLTLLYATRYKNRKILYYGIIFFSWLALVISFSSLGVAKSSYASFTYELYNLFSFIPYAVAFCILFPTKKINYLFYVWFGFFIVNIAVILAQYFLGIEIVRYFGVNVEVIGYQIVNQRVTGLFDNANILGTFCFLTFILCYSVLYIKKEKHKYYCLIATVLVTGVILSGSRQTILQLVLLSLFLHGGRSKSKWALYGILLIALISFLYTIDLYQMKEKLGHYIFLYNALTQGLEVTLEDVEVRAFYLTQSFIYFSEYAGVGSGLGTWGDYSSTMAEKKLEHISYIPMSDSYLSHILVEQGVAVVLYISLVCLSFDKYKLMFFMIWFLGFIFSMGMSQALQPTLVGTLILASYILHGRVKRNKVKVAA